MKIKHRLSVLLVPVLLFLLISPTFVVSGVDLPSPTQTFYVNDFTSILSEETEDHLLQTNDLLEPQTGAQIVTVTVDFLDGLNSEEYAYQLFNDWGIGSKEENNGVLLLLSPGEEKYWITVGTGLEKVLSSGTLSKILDENRDDLFSQQQYDRFVTEVFDEIAEILAQHYHVTLDGDAGFGQHENSESDTGNFVEDLLFWIILFAVIGLSLGSTVLRGSIGRRYRRPPYPPVHMDRRVRRYGPGPHFGNFGPRPGNFGSRPGAGFGGGANRPVKRPGGGSHSFGGGARRSGGGGRSRGGGAGRR